MALCSWFSFPWKATHCHKPEERNPPHLDSVKTFKSQREYFWTSEKQLNKVLTYFQKSVEWAYRGQDIRRSAMIRSGYLPNTDLGICCHINDSDYFIRFLIAVFWVLTPSSRQNEQFYNQAGLHLKVLRLENFKWCTWWQVCVLAQRSRAVWRDRTLHYC